MPRSAARAQPRLEDVEAAVGEAGGAQAQVELLPQQGRHASVPGQPGIERAHVELLQRDIAEAEKARVGLASAWRVLVVLETHLGWAARILGLKFATPVFDGIKERDIRDYIKQAGSKKQFRHIDFDYVLAFAQWKVVPVPPMGYPPPYPQPPQPPQQ